MHSWRKEEFQVIVLVSANAEWETVLRFYKDPTVQKTPFGTYFYTSIAGKSTVLFHGGWGKISAAASAQYAIDHWNPGLLINIGTCGGLAGKTHVGELLLVEQTLVYDIYERMGDPAAAISHYSTQLDLSFLNEPFPQNVRKVRLVSADQDIDPDLVYKLMDDYSAIAADWESGAIAWTAQQNQIRCLILRGVSDLVDPLGGEIYESGEFHDRAQEIMYPILKALPNWIRCALWGIK
ncbi:MAG: S-adenosylhomocysteine/5'-methylthioadenosine nucleosidase [Chloroflexi bacterium]|nr:MAG: S-adenosylhomocysteine/5'-methylthioadenosine nucleosidase [Chloroflexota bacterium]MBA4374946.1 hypothetical protein [Anaerolinea sp.]